MTKGKLMEIQGFQVRPGQPILWQRIEAAVIFVACLVVYYHLRLNGWLLVLLILAPDLSMVGYTRNTALGATLYNLAHNYGVPLVILLLSWGLSSEIGITVGLIWLAHCGMDRAVGYGLKYPTSFQETHLGRIGRNRPA
jgi:hypothetical protein